MGDGTTRRQPRPASSFTTQPCSAASSLAVASSMCEPIGLVGSRNAGSSRSTSVSVTTATGSRWMPRLAKFVAKRLDEHVADRALQVGAGIVHRHRRNLVDREFRAAQDVPHLRAVAVGDDHVPPGLDHVGDVMSGERGRFVLIWDRLMILVADERVAADRDDRELLVRPHPTPPNASGGHASGSSFAKRRDGLQKNNQAARA